MPKLGHAEKQAADKDEVVPMLLSLPEPAKPLADETQEHYRALIEWVTVLSNRHARANPGSRNPFAEVLEKLENDTPQRRRASSTDVLTQAWCSNYQPSSSPLPLLHLFLQSPKVQLDRWQFRLDSRILRQAPTTITAFFIFLILLQRGSYLNACHD
ncbi:hypothetical protein C8R42DRAFT_722825 [Lentinula raphanica]|nr:hypothetical protein C8R42DRAFT_722825 [Lentinula raphanica]